MWSLDYSSADSIKKVLYENNFSMQKKFGQNFLLNTAIINKISDIITNDVEKDRKIYEIGPGLGALTHTFFLKGYGVRAFEIDKGFIDILKNQAFCDEKLEIVEGDCLETLFNESQTPLVLCGNLPYNISTLLIADIIEKGVCGGLPEKMVFLLQKEVCDRFVINQRNAKLSHLSFETFLSYDVKIAMNVKRGCFFPSPNVDSALLVFKKKDEVIDNQDLRKKTISFSRVLFSAPRKTIYNNMRNNGYKNAQDLLESLKINPNVRAEDLIIDDIIKLGERI